MKMQVAIKLFLVKFMNYKINKKVPDELNGIFHLLKYELVSDPNGNKYKKI